jgi:phage terminase large subunit-like protein
VNAFDFAALPPAKRAKIIGQLSQAELRALRYAWKFWARPKQLPPPGNWLIWLLLAGRGFGKTRTGAQFIHQRAMEKRRHIVLAGATAADIRDTMIEGDSGLLACAPPGERPIYNPSKARVTWKNGSWARLISADKPDKFRGPNCDTFWADELAAWRYAQAAWDQLMMSFRVGDDLRGVISTTPRPTPIIKWLVSREPEHVRVITGTSYENEANLNRQWFDTVIRPHEGTRLGRQELEAHILEDSPGALWSRAQIDEDRVGAEPETQVRVAVAIDHATSTNQGVAAQKAQAQNLTGRKPNKTAIVAGCTGPDPKGKDKRLHAFILQARQGEWTPEQWAKRAFEVFDEVDADYFVIERNQGGDLVAANLRTIKRDAKIVEVNASKGKATRAEPVASLDEQHRIHHVGCFGELEDQLCTWEPDLGMESPDLLDARVWLLTDLMIDKNPNPPSRGGRVIKSVPFEDRPMGYG